MGSPSIRFAVMVNRDELYPWQIKVIEEIKHTHLAECILIIQREEDQPVKRSFFQKLFQKNVLFELYKKTKLNTTLYQPTHYPPFDSIEKITVQVNRSGKNNESLNDADIEKIRSCQLHFILRFGFGILTGEILNSAKWGIWSYHHADEQEFRGGPAGYWELVKNKCTQGVILQQLTERLDAGKIILKRHYGVVHDSYTANVTLLHMHSTDMPAQAIRMIHAGLMDPAQWQPVKTTAKVFHYPTNFQFILFGSKMVINKIKASYARIFKQENWVVGYTMNHETRYVTSPNDPEYFADPFILPGSLIIAEHFSYKTQKGSIVLVEPGSHQFKTLIEKTTHLSYPFVFEESGTTYVIPEESDSGKVNLYEWNSSTRELHFIRILIHEPIIDPSILKYGGKYYLFGGLKGQLPNEKLFIFYADKLEGPYQPHICNPVKCTREGARMGGVFFEENGKIIRAGQYSVNHYGEKLLFFSIDELSPTEFKESLIREMKPNQQAPFKCGLHNYHKKDNLEVFDQKTMRSGITALRAQL